MALAVRPYAVGGLGGGGLATLSGWLLHLARRAQPEDIYSAASGPAPSACSAGKGAPREVEEWLFWICIALVVIGPGLDLAIALRSGWLWATGRQARARRPLYGR